MRTSVAGRVRAFDNIFVELLWRTVKFKEVCLQVYATVKEAIGSLGGILHILQ